MSWLSSRELRLFFVFVFQTKYFLLFYEKDVFVLSLTFFHNVLCITNDSRLITKFLAGHDKTMRASPKKFPVRVLPVLWLEDEPEPVCLKMVVPWVVLVEMVNEQLDSAREAVDKAGGKVHCD